MVTDRVVARLERAGWAMVDADAARDDPTFLVLQRGTVRKAILVLDEPPGPVRIGAFGALCRRQRLRGLLVCPDDAAVAELCEQAGLEFLAAEGFLEVPSAAPVPPLARPRPVEAAIPEAAPMPHVAVAPPTSARRATVPGIPWRRWSIVAFIWIAALAAVAYDVWRWTA